MYTKKRVFETLMVLAATLLLASCGGGGGGGAAETIQSFTVTITADRANLLSNEGDVTFEPGTDFATNVTVRINRSDGSAVPDGQPVSITVSNSALGALSTVNDLINLQSSLSLTTTGGIATAVFHTRDQTGNVQVTAAAFDGAANRNVSSSVSFSIAQGPEPVRRIQLDAARVNIPANRFGVAPFLGSPYITELTVTYRNAEGTLAAPEDGTVGVSIDPVTTAAFSTLDDPTTTDINEFFVLVGNAPVSLAGGRGTVFVHSFDIPGTVTVSVSAQDPDTAEIFDDTFQVTVVEPASDGLPANLTISAAAGAQYIQGSGGETARAFEVAVSDGAGVAVPDPNTNNVILEVLTEQPNSGETLRSTTFSGQNTEGTSIGVGTTAGRTGASLISGSEPGIVRIRATADAADNDVGNGIQGPVVAETQAIISDGIPFSVTLSTLPINTLTVNPVDPNVTIEDPDPTDGIPPQPNATYTLRVGAIITDRFGNPPAQPVELQFGLIDSPLDGYPAAGAGVFAMSGFDGDPNEGGTSFFAPTGEFTFGGGGAGPNDTLILFGKDVVGNDDLESARTVDRVIDRFNLIVDEPFNFNDFTGGSVDYGRVLPYVIGRALVGNIESGAVTDSDGVAVTNMNYPASGLGRTSAIYVQGANATLGGSGALATYADASIIRYPGLAPLSLTASPNSIQGNTTVGVLVCVQDNAQVPLVGQFVTFSVSEGGSAVVAVDGVAGAGVVANPTGFDGCTVAQVSSSGVVESGNDPIVTFTVGESSDEVKIERPNATLLQAIPSTIVGNTTNGVVTLRLLDEGGNPLSGVAIGGMCDPGDGLVLLTNPPGTTDANGETTATISADVDGFICSNGLTPPAGLRTDAVTDASCTFTTAGGDADVEVGIIGTLTDLAAFSPSPCI